MYVSEQAFSEKEIIRFEVSRLGVVDSILNFFKMDSEDDYDEYDDYDDDYEDDDEPSERKPLFGRKKKEKTEEDVEPQADKGRIVPMRRSPRQGSVEMEVCIIKPTSMEDAREITETLLSGRSVVLNMDGLNLDIAQRIIDFSGGSTYAIGGNLQKVSGNIFVLTPPNVEISGDIQSFIGSVESSVELDS